MQPPFPSLTSTWHNETYAAIDPTQPHLSVSEKTVFITGGGRGIGARIAHAFAAAGASIVAITGRTQSSLDSTAASIEKQYPKAKVLTFAVDVVDGPGVNAAFASVKEASPHKQGVDICIVNAGYLPSPAPLTPPSASASAEDSSREQQDWWKAFETNVLGAYVTTRAFLANMHVKSSSGHPEPVLIDVTTAGVCFFPPLPAFSGYIASEVARSRFFESVGAENPDVRVVNFHPGSVGTDMGKKAAAAGLELPQDDGK